MSNPNAPGRPISDKDRQKAYRERERRAIERAETYPSKRLAYATGYKTGYSRAYRHFKAKLDRVLKQMQAADVSRRDGRAA